MCGIYITNLQYPKVEIQQKLNSIKYRGPDYTGITSINNITLGHLRLSILDLDPRSNQPMQRGSLHLVFNGEIYNYKILKRDLASFGHTFETTSDTEVLLAGYKQWGKELPKKLNGMFSFAIYDETENKIFAARDRSGQKPFYYYWKDGQFEICSQLRPLINGNSVLSEEALAMYLDCRYVPSPFSIIKDVWKLRPGCSLEIKMSTQKIHTEQYWDLRKVKPNKIKYHEAKQRLHDLLKDAVKIRLQSDVPLGSFLSGGIDSALISSIASSVGENKLNTFCIGFKNPKYDESSIASSYAKILDSNHNETICEAEQIKELIPKLVEVYDEPFADSSALPSLLLNSVVKGHVTVALSGDGGDESFLGYQHFDLLNRLKKVMILPYWLRKTMTKLPIAKILNNPTESINNVLNTKTSRDYFKFVYIGFKTLLAKRNLNWLSYYESYKYLSKDYLQSAADYHIKLWLENDSNVKVDRASMAYSVEVRSPFLDYRIIEFARSLPVSYRYDKKRKKKILRDILKEYIPEDVFDQPKSGFSIPLDDWIRGDLKEEFMTTITDDFLNKLPNFNVQRFKNLLHEHMNGTQNNATNIWKLYVLAKWFQEFKF